MDEIFSDEVYERMAAEYDRQLGTERFAKLALHDKKPPFTLESQSACVETAAEPCTDAPIQTKHSRIHMLQQLYLDANPDNTSASLLMAIVNELVDMLN